MAWRGELGTGEREKQTLAQGEERDLSTGGEGQCLESPQPNTQWETGGGGEV